jgi:WD40 repeat protein
MTFSRLPVTLLLAALPSLMTSCAENPADVSAQSDERPEATPPDERVPSGRAAAALAGSPPPGRKNIAQQNDPEGDRKGDSGVADHSPKSALARLAPLARSGVSQYSPDGKWFAIGADDVRLFDAESREYVKQIPIGKYPLVALDFSDDSRMLAVGMWTFAPQEQADARGFEIVVVSVPDGKQRYRLTGLPEQRNWRRRVAISPDGKSVATSNSKQIAVYDLQTGKITWQVHRDELEIVGSSYSSLDVTPDWKYFLFNLQRVSYPSKQTIPMVRFNDQERPFFRDNLISADGKQAAALGGENGSEQRLFDLESGKLLQEIKDVPSYSFAAAPDFKRFVNAHGHWSAETGKLTKLPAHANPFEEWYAVSADGQEATVGAEAFRLDAPGDDAKLGTWGSTESSIQGLAVAFNDEGAALIESGSRRRRVDLATGTIGEMESCGSRSSETPRTRFGTFPNAKSPDGKFSLNGAWLMGTDGSKKYLFEAIDAKKRPKGVQPHFVTDARAVLLSGDHLYVIDVPAGNFVHTIDLAKTEEVTGMVNSSDGRMLAVSQGSSRTGHRRSVALVDLQTGRVVMPPQSLGYSQMSMHASGQQLACYGDKWVNLYDCQQGKLSGQAKLRTGIAVSATYHPTEALLFVVTDNATVEVIGTDGKHKAFVAGRGYELTKNMALIRRDAVTVAGDATKLFATP